MNSDINNYIVRNNLEWKPLIEIEVQYKGVWVKSLRYDSGKGRSTSILLKFEPGSSYPYHNHPAGEEIYVLEGEVIIEGTTLTKGDYLYTPPDFKHSVRSEKGCTLLLVIPEEVQIL